MAPPPFLRHARWSALLALCLTTGIGAATAQPMDRARAAQMRGDLRAAQIEYRNAVRADPASASARAALAAASLDLGDGDTAEKEARAALERGFDPVVGTAMLLRAYLLQNRAQDLLRDFAVPTDPARSAVAGQVAAARTLAQLNLNERDAARRSATEAVRLSPAAAEPHLAVAAVAATEGNRAAAEAAVDQALAANPESADALLRKATLVFERGEPGTAVELLGWLLARSPGYVPARVLRAEAFFRINEPAKARAEVDAALRTQPNSAPAAYLRALLLIQGQDWRGADDIFQRLGSALANFPDGFLFQAVTKRALGQTAQADDSIRRYVARRPDEIRGAKLLATMEMEANRPAEAAGVLSRFAARGTPDAEAFDMLGRALAAAGKHREAADAFNHAVGLAPNDGALMARLAAARLVAGDTAGSATAAQNSLQLSPNQAGAREMLAVAAFARSDLATAEAEINRLSPAARHSEMVGTLAGTIRLARLDPAGARATFETVLRDFPTSTNARLGLARALAAQNDLPAAERLLAEVLQREPGNAEAISRMTSLALSGGPRAPAARAALETARAAALGETALALAVANVLAAGGDVAQAANTLDAEPLRAPGRGVGLPLARSQIFAAAGRWPEAEAAARAAMAESPDSAQARRQLAALLARGGDARAAEALLQEGLRSQPGNALLLQALVGQAQQAHGIEAALALADRLSQQPATQPASRLLRGDLLLTEKRPVEAAQAYAAAYADAPSSVLALRQASAWRAAGRPADARAALNAWLQRQPDDVAALSVRAQIDIEAGRFAEAEAQFVTVVDRAPTDAVALNNLAWLLGEHGGPAAMPRARAFAERAYFLLPNAEIADTLGWILARSGDARLAVPLLRQAVANRGPAADPGMAYRFAVALRSAGEREEALRVLEPALANDAAFAERAAAERLLTELRAGL